MTANAPPRGEGHQPKVDGCRGLLYVSRKAGRAHAALIPEGRRARNATSLNDHSPAHPAATQRAPPGRGARLARHAGKARLLPMEAAAVHEHT